MARPGRRASDSDLFAHLPVWARATVVLGVPSVIALFLVYALTAGVAGRLTAMEKQQALSAQVLAQMRDTQETAHRDLQAALTRVDRLLQRLCLASATSEAARTQCLAETP